MDDYHERLARVGLAATDGYGFALAGGYAVQAAGLVERPSVDVDLFTAWDRRGDFDTAVTRVVDSYRADGLDVDVEVRLETFARLIVTDRAGGRESKVELGADWRAHPPVRLAIGPVLHPDDAVANKMSALYGRAECRDFVDIDGALTSGRYDRQRLLTLAETADAGFDRQMFAAAIGSISRIDPAVFASYGVTGEHLQALKARFADWRTELLAR